MRRMAQLDILRGIAILMVLGAHPVAKLDEAGWFWPLADLRQFGLGFLRKSFGDGPGTATGHQS